MNDMLSRSLDIRAIREDAREVDFICSTQTVDSYDSIIRGPFDLKRYKKNPVVLFAHQGRELPIGKAKNVRVEDDVLIATFVIATAEANPLAENVWQSIRQETLRGASIGFYAKTAKWEKHDDVEVLVLEDIELLEISVTPIPSNPDAIAKLRQRALEAAGREAPTKTPATPPAPPGKPATERGEQESRMTIEAENAALKSTVAERDAALTKREAEVRVAEKALADTRAERDVLKTQNEALVTERDAFKGRAEKAEADLVERDVDAIVGKKITPAEKPTFLKLARSNPDLFKEMVAQRSDLPTGPTDGKTSALAAPIGDPPKPAPDATNNRDLADEFDREFEREFAGSQQRASA